MVLRDATILRPLSDPRCIIEHFLIQIILTIG